MPAASNLDMVVFRCTLSIAGILQIIVHNIKNALGKMWSRDPSCKEPIKLVTQPRPQDQLLDDFQNGGSSGPDDPPLSPPFWKSSRSWSWGRGWLVTNALEGSEKELYLVPRARVPTTRPCVPRLKITELLNSQRFQRVMCGVFYNLIKERREDTAYYFFHKRNQWAMAWCCVSDIKSLPACSWSGLIISSNHTNKVGSVCFKVSLFRNGS